MLSTAASARSCSTLPYGVQAFGTVQAHCPRLPFVCWQMQVRLVCAVVEQVVSQTSSVRVSQRSPLLVPRSQVGSPPSLEASGAPPSGAGQATVEQRY